LLGSFRGELLNVVFDLGGVVVRWEPDALIAKVFSDPLLRTAIRAEFVRHADWVALDRGTLSPRDAIERAAKRIGLPETDVEKFLQQVPPALVPISDMINLLYRLKANGHTLFCLSNMHVASIEYLEKAYTFWEVFEGVVVSCRLQLCKPEPAIYSYLLETYGLNANDTVFIDDTPENITAAAELGLHTLRFESPSQCERELRALGCL
jgi:putative hydrolase of the HAD superfamily